MPAQPHAAWQDVPKVVLLGSAFELCLASLLLVGAWSAAIRWVSIGTFALFACVAATEAVGGAKSCGCVGGGIHIPPWFMAGFDFLTVVVLLRSRVSPASSPFSLRLGLVRLAFAVAIILTGTAMATTWELHRPVTIIAQANPKSVAADPLGVPGSLVLIDPDKLAGKQFLLSSHVDAGSQLQRGRWIVLLVHHDCDVCAGAVPKYQSAILTAGEAKLAIIEMPRYAASGEPAPWPTSTGLFGKLDTTRDWFATTPVALELQDGIVRTASDGERAAIPASFVAHQ